MENEMVEFYHVVGYTNYNRARYLVEYFPDVLEFEIESIGTTPWSCNTSFWIVPGTINIDH